MTPRTTHAPKSIDETGVRRNLLEDLALKTLYFEGELSLHELGRRMGLTPRIVEDLFQRLRRDQLCQVTGMEGNVHRITTTSGGKTRALELLAQNHYVGPAPVSLDDYVRRVLEQNVTEVEVTPLEMEKAFENLVLDPELLNQLGTAVRSGRAVFLYGPTGTGKSVIAETLARLFEQDQILVPYAVEVDGQIITVYDPALHHTVEGQSQTHHDPRWQLCRRPCVLAGGEMTIEMVDLQFNPVTKFYSAPIQMKANNGLLIVDDFGRQRMNPEELLNRWVVPLERRIDFLSFAGGKKVEIPFNLFVVFATNLDPATMVDEAFLRRIQTKIKVDFVRPDQFHEISQGVCRQTGLTYNADAVEGIIRMIGNDYNEPLRACYPRDIMQQIVWAARYAQREPVLDMESVTMACRNYFLAP